MQIEGKRKNVKRRTSYLKRPCRTKSTCASSPFDSAKILRNTETAKQNLKNLAEKYEGINNVEGFLNDLWLALGIQNQGGNKRGGKPSRYALYQLQDGTMLTISIRASAHNANANKYIEHPPVPDINLSIVLQKKMRRNQFKDNPSVNIGEYVYVNQKIQGIESPLSQIANSLIGFLNNGEYVDTTGVAIVHGDLKTPQDIINNQQNINCNLNMNKKQIRLTESDLKQIVKESVNKIISEAYGTPDNATQSKVDYLRTNNFEKGDEMQKVWSEVRNALFNLKSRAKWLIGHPYEEAIVKATDGYEKKLNSIFKIWSNKLIQINGEQPDAKYNERHNGGDTPSVGWTRGPESYFTRGY